MFLNIVTNEELMASEVVKTILLTLIVIGIIYNLVQLIRVIPKRRKRINATVLLFLFLLFFFVGKEFLVELAFLRDSEYITGTTTGYGSVFALGKGIKFEYEVNGEKFMNCNTYYPISKDSIKVPEGRYSVRIPKKFPKKGRMDFKKMEDK